MQSRKNYYRNFWTKEIRPMFRRQYLRDDFGAAIAVAFVAIPLSLAISLATGVGAAVGLTSAIIGGILGALFGGCRLGVTGPAVAMSVLLATTLESYGFAGLLIVGLICGALQISFGILKWGRIAKYIPLSLVLGFAAGIGFLLFFEQLPYAFQVQSEDKTTFMDIIRHWELFSQHLGSMSLLLTVITIAILAIVPRFLPRAYAFIFAVIIPVALVKIFAVQVAVVGPIPHNLLHFEDFDFAAIHHWGKLFLTGVEVFILASLETLLSTSSIDLMGDGDFHDPNQELIGQGIANVGVSMMGGIPVTGIVARSSVNVLAGAKTRRAAIFHSLLILAVVFMAPQLIENVPIAVLAGILIAASIKMMNFRQVFDLWKTDRLEVAVYAVTFIAMITTDLINGIEIGLLAAFAVIAYRMLSTKAEIKVWTNNNVVRMGLNGALSFLSYEKLLQLKEYALSQEQAHFVIFEFGQLQNVDTSGAKHLVSIAQELSDAGRQVIFHGMKDFQQAIINGNAGDNPPFLVTVTEYQIKDILEKSGVKHSVEDVLRHGITKYTANYAKENKQLLTTLAKGQNPHTLLITCSDSRLNPNAFFSADIGDLFIVRNVGNVVPPYMPNNIYSEIAAIEYAVNELKVRNIVVCAHTECGAIKASYTSGDDKLGYVGLDNWLSLIKDGFRQHKPHDAKHGVEVNLLHQVNNLKTYPKIGEMIASSEITVNAWIYDVHSGHILEWSEPKAKFIEIV